MYGSPGAELIIPIAVIIRIGSGGIREIDGRGTDALIRRSGGCRGRRTAQAGRSIIGYLGSVTNCD